MARKTRRFSVAVRIESLESRLVMTGSASGTALQGVIGPWDSHSGQTVLVGFKTGLSQATLNADLAGVGGRLVTFRDNGPSLVAIPAWDNLTSAIQQLSNSTGVRYATPNSQIHAESVVIPNDPYYGNQWGLSFIDAPSAWGITTGTSSTLVAVLDTGIDLRSADLSGKVWNNPNPGSSGHAGDYHGWNFVTNTSNIQDNNGHGTGILAASSNNAYGVAGVNWNATIMPVKILDSQGNGSLNNAIAGIYYAVNNGARVINASWGGVENSQALVDALNYANSHNVVFVTAAGNDSSNNDVVPSYPASYRTPNELVVAAIDPSGNLASYSNYGANTVDIAAPGTNIYSTVVGGFANYTGTSMSTPFVAGTAALLAGQFPNMSAADIAARIRDTAKPLDSLKGVVITGGVVDPYYALINRTRGGGSGSVSMLGAPSLNTHNSTRNAVESAILGGNAVYATLGNNPNNFVINTYNAIFDRKPSADEIKFHGTAIASGTETRYGLIYQLQGSTEGLRTKVARWYQEELGRTASIDTLKYDSGVAYWADKLAKGSSESQVQVNMLAGDAYYKLVGGTPSSYVQAIYQAILDRDANPDEVSYNATQLKNGLSRATLVNVLLNSTEGRITNMAHLYSDELGRPGTTAQLKNDSGVQYWANFLGYT